MFVYLDESGDAGFKFREGSSRYFVVTSMIVHDPVPIHRAVDDLRLELGMRRDNEFKWYRSSEGTRWAFLRMLRKQDFTARVLVVDKLLMATSHGRNPDLFYSLVVRMVLEQDNSINDATLILDESVQSRKGKQALTTYLRKALNTDVKSRKIGEIRYHRSRSDNIVQAADMLSGAIYAKYRRGKGEYLEFIKMKVSDLREWNPRTQ
jgi:Protein of unknown function (DUF3800)